MYRFIVIDDEVKKTALCAWFVETERDTHGFFMRIFYAEHSWLDAFIQKSKELLKANGCGFQRRIPPYDPLRGRGVI